MLRFELMFLPVTAAAVETAVPDDGCGVADDDDRGHPDMFKRKRSERGQLDSLLIAAGVMNQRAAASAAVMPGTTSISTER